MTVNVAVVEIIVSLSIAGNRIVGHLGDLVRDRMMDVLRHLEILPAGYRLIKIAGVRKPAIEILFREIYNCDVYVFL